MTDADARALVVRCLQEIAPESDPAALPDDADVRVALDLDSMDVFNFVVALAAAGGVEIPDADVPRLTSVGGAVAYLTRHATPTT